MCNSRQSQVQQVQLTQVVDPVSTLPCFLALFFCCSYFTLTHLNSHPPCLLQPVFCHNAQNAKRKFCESRKAGKSRRQQCNMYKYTVKPGRVSGEFKPLQGVTPLPRSHRHINWKKRNRDRQRGMSYAYERQFTLCKCPMLLNTNLPYVNVLC